MRLNGQKWLGRIAKVLEDSLDGRPYIVGDSFTAADVAVGSAIGWMAFVGVLHDHPKLAAYLAALQERPAYKRAHAD